MRKKNIFENFSGIKKFETNNEENEETQSSSEPMETEKDIRTFPLFKGVVWVFLFILFVRLLNLQVTQGAENQFLAEGNRIRARRIIAPRGIIYDQRGTIVVKNIASFSLSIFPSDLPKDKEERKNIYDNLRKITASDEKIFEEFEKIENKELVSKEEIVLKEGISREEAILFESQILDFPGVAVTKRPIRDYQREVDLGQVLGYIGKISKDELEKEQTDYYLNSEIGKEGIEKTYERYLKGQNGEERIEVDSRGYFQRRLATVEPTPGNALKLYLNLGLQKEAAYQLKEKLKEKKLNKGVVIALDPNSGGILASVSIPSYDNNLFSQGINSKEYQSLLENQDKPLLNRVVNGVYPSGSTIKPMIAAAGLEEKVISERTTITDPGSIQIGQWSFPDWKNHGLTDVKKAIAESCNVFFYSVGGGYGPISGLGIKRLDRYLELFGFGSKTGIDLPTEAAGLLPTPEWKKTYKKESWYIGDTYHLSIGQGDFLVSPLQMGRAIATIANNGRLLKPQLISEIISQDGKTLVKNSPEEIRSGFINPNNLRIVREGMRQTVTDGSARLLSDLPFTSAGKTGTAQFGNEGKTHSWFVSFAPYENPEIVLVVMIEEGGEGHETALPIAKNILKWYFENK